MILGIDASNIRGGGGVTHLAEMLNACDPSAHGFSKVIIWSGSQTLHKMPERDWLEKKCPPYLNKNIFYRMFWQRFKLSAQARDEKCSILFAPGGSYAGDFHPVVSMSQNLLPFEWKELSRYGFSLRTIKMLLLRIVQTRTFRSSDGIIFLTAYAHKVVSKIAKQLPGKIAIIPHGINRRFVAEPRKQLSVAAFSDSDPFRMLYVSIVDMYKHQWNLAESVVALRKQGIPVTLDLVGPSYGPALDILKKKLAEIDPDGKCVTYHGPVAYETLHQYYQHCHMYVFASTCENMPNILLEGMAAGLPIACSASGPMPEVLEEGGVYFNPLDVHDITRALRSMILSEELRTEKAAISFSKAAGYSWEKCAAQTFDFFRGTAQAKVFQINN